MFPKDMANAYSNGTFRSSYSGDDKGVVFVGMQFGIQAIFDEAGRRFFESDRAEMMAKYTDFVDNYAGVDVVDPEDIGDLYDLGYFPLEIRALPEGTFVPYGVPAFTIESTLGGWGWLPNRFESIISCMIWGPTTSATAAFKFREMLDFYAALTSDAPDFVDFQAHDFCMRGMWGYEAAGMSGIGHLASFTGTDNIPSIRYVEEYYDAAGFIGAGVPATEHSVACAGGAENEKETLIRLIKQRKPGEILSFVADTWDYFHFITVTLADPEVITIVRESGIKLVVRPDSGVPDLIVNGDPKAAEDSPERKGTLRILEEIYGSTVNSKGYKVLDPSIGIIYGDGITFERGDIILTHMKENGFASTNIVLGLGSFYYTFVTRDTHGFAMKMTWAEVDGEGRMLQKDPKTQSGSIKKKSALGRLVVVDDGDGYRLIDGIATRVEQESYDDVDFLRPIWRDGRWLRRTTLEEIRNNVKKLPRLAIS